MTQSNFDLWKTPGPYLGLLMGLGSPLVFYVYASAGWLAALGTFIVLGGLAFGVLRKLQTAEVRRIYGSSALVRYTYRFMLATLAYVVGMLIAVSIYNANSSLGLLAYPVSLLPTLPALAMIVVMGLYLFEEEDEYLRHRASVSSIIGLGFVLVLGTVWGFLETFGLVPHIWAWWVVPAWAMGLGMGQGLLSLSEGSAKASRNSADANSEEPV